MDEILERNNEQNIVHSIICPQCNSTDIEMESDKRGICKHCGTQIVVTLPKPDVTENIYVFTDKDNERVERAISKAREKVQYYTLKNNLSQKSFFRASLLDLIMNPKSPSDIMESEFSTPYLSYDEFVLAKANTSVEYSCSVGYTRGETYRVYDNARKTYVNKTRWITDWQPYNGKHSGTYIACSRNEDESLKDDLEISKSIKKLYKNGELASASEEGADADVSSLNKSCVKRIRKEFLSDINSDIKNKAPGDKIKDLRAEPSLDIQSTVYVKVPKWSLKYKYKETEYEYTASEGRGNAIGGTLPIKETDQEELEIEKVSSKNLLLTILAIISIAFILCSSLFAGLNVDVGNPILIISTLACAIVGITSYVFYVIKRRKIIQPLVNDLRGKRIIQVKALFSSKELDELNEEEEKALEDKLSSKITGTDGLNALTNIICIIGAIFAISCLLALIP